MNKTNTLDSEENIWQNLLQIKKDINSYEDLQVSFSIHYSENRLLLKKLLTEQTGVIFKFDIDEIKKSLASQSVYDVLEKCFTPLSKEIHFAEFIKLYLPYCILPIIAKIKQRTISITHFAQTLDGKIAANNGDSKWIGNEENLLHSHRMRALCEGILVGRKTIEIDNPRLNVRLCSGENPQRIALGNSLRDRDFKKLIPSDYIEISSTDTDEPDHILIDKKACFNGKNILRSLYKKGINSVYIEGGSQTSSAFLNSNSVDEVQLHISPIILGSGIPNFNLPEVSTISDGIHFEDFMFIKMGDAMMFIGSPKKRA